MKKSVLAIVLALGLTSCVTTKQDPVTMKLKAMSLENNNNDKKVKVELLSKYEEKTYLEVILSDGKFIIPNDKVVTRYEIPATQIIRE
jgi:hypothetical protein